MEQAPISRPRRIEDYPPGYPRFAALIAAVDSFSICRRFSSLRSRLLLLKQDKLCRLEKQLERVDSEETALLFLARSRSDTNAERLSVLAEIDVALADYDSFNERTSRVLQLTPADSRDVESLENWVMGTACIATEETRYLSFSKDLVSLASTEDSVLTNLETWVEDSLIHFYKDFRQLPLHETSTDPHVYVYSGPLVNRIARAILLLLLLGVLLTPVVACLAIKHAALQIIVIVSFNVLLLATLSCFAKSRTFELFIAGATYCTLLTVFLTNNHSSPG